MQKNTVRYNNYLNSLEFRRFSAGDFDLLMFLCAKLRDQGSNTVTVTFDEIKTVIGYDHHATCDEFIKILVTLNEKIMDMRAKVKDGSKTMQFVLFPTFITDDEAYTLTVDVNTRFQFILNELVKNFTQFELAEFVGLKSKHSKTLYRLLKQYRNTGDYYVRIDELRRLFCVSDKFQTRYIYRDIINPAVMELRGIFKELSVEQIRAATRGRPVTGYHFSFAPEGQIPGQTTIEQAAQEMQRYKATRQTRQTAKNPKKGSFNDFDQRDYDYADMARKLAQMD